MKVDGLTDDQDVVWSRQASYLDGNGQVQMIVKFLTRAEYDALLEAFGQNWLDRYLADAERFVERFRQRGIH